MGEEGETEAMTSNNVEGERMARGQLGTWSGGCRVGRSAFGWSGVAAGVGFLARWRLGSRVSVDIGLCRRRAGSRGGRSASMSVRAARLLLLARSRHRGWACDRVGCWGRARRLRISRGRGCSGKGEAATHRSRQGCSVASWRGERGRGPACRGVGRAARGRCDLEKK
jgi:hypothetical protein